MTPDAHDHEELCRSERRRRSGVRAGMIWGTVLLLALLIYLGMFAVMENISANRWRAAINQAFRQEENISEISALLEACRIQAPRVAKRPEYAGWQNRLRTLQKRRENRKLLFKTQLDELKKLLDSENADHIKLNLALANIARNASDEAELTELRTLQARCEALSEMRELATARSGVAEIDELKKLHEQITESLHRRDLQTFEQLDRKGQSKIKLLLQTYYKFPEITAQARRLSKKFRSSAELAQKLRADILLENKDIEEVFKSTSLEKLQHNCQLFLKNHPRSEFAIQVQYLQKQLRILEHDNTQKTRQLLADMIHRREQAKLQLQRDLQNIANMELKSSLRELTIQQADSTLMSWTTSDLGRFSQPDADDMRSIAFVTTDGQKLQGSFDASGNGNVTVNGKTYSGKLYSGKAEGALPNCYWQQKLLDICYVNVQSEFFTLISELPGKIENDPRFPERIKTSLLNILADANKTFKTTPEQYIFSQAVLEYCIQHPITFAGMVYCGNDGKEQFCSVQYMGENDQATIWLVFDQKPFFKHFQKNKPFADDRYPHIAVTSKGFVDYTDKLAQWRKTAAEKNLQLPELPDFLQGM